MCSVVLLEYGAPTQESKRPTLLFLFWHSEDKNLFAKWVYFIHHFFHLLGITVGGPGTLLADLCCYPGNWKIYGQ
jgi:hypothetical protein